MEKSSIIYIEDLRNEKEFTKKLKSLIRSIDDEVKIITLTELIDQKKDNEEGADLAAKTINNSDITISIIDNSYISGVNEYVQVKSAIQKIQDSENRYYFPIIYSQSNWINTDWLLKAKLYPSDSSISELSNLEIDKLLNKLLNNLKIILSKKEITKSKVTKKSISKKNEIFISHSNVDTDFAELLQYKLKENGYESWLDTDELKVGQDWREEIDKGIENSLAIVVILSPEARNSEYVTYEWAYASGIGKMILPLLLRKTQIHPKLEILQYLDFTNIRARPYEDLFERIARIK